MNPLVRPTITGAPSVVMKMSLKRGSFLSLTNSMKMWEISLSSLSFALMSPKTILMKTQNCATSMISGKNTHMRQCPSSALLLDIFCRSLTSPCNGILGKITCPQPQSPFFFLLKITEECVCSIDKLVLERILVFTENVNDLIRCNHCSLTLGVTRGICPFYTVLKCSKLPFFGKVTAAFLASVIFVFCLA